MSYGNVDIASVRYGHLFGCMSFLFRMFFEGTEFLLNMMTIISSTLTRFRALSKTSPKVLGLGKGNGGSPAKFRIVATFEFDQLVTHFICFKITEHYTQVQNVGRGTEYLL